VNGEDTGRSTPFRDEMKRGGGGMRRKRKSKSHMYTSKKRVPTSGLEREARRPEKRKSGEEKDPLTWEN